MGTDGLYQSLLSGARTPLGKVLACSLVGALFSLSVVVADDSMRRHWVAVAVSGAAIGAFAAGLLLLRDRVRRRTRKWKTATASAARELLKSGLAQDEAEAAAKAEETASQYSFGFLLWTGMVVGGLIILCGLIMAVVHTVEFIFD